MNKIVFSLLILLCVSACSTTGLQERTLQSPVPVSCLTKCSNLPRASSFEQFAFEVVPLYAECAVLHEQCSAALTEQLTKE